MKKAVLVALVLALFTGMCMAAPATVLGPAPVSLTTSIPAYIGFSSPTATTINFDYSALGLAVATGLPITKLGSANPTWTLMYNLPNKPTITVCAYVSTPLTGAVSGYVWPAADLFVSANGGGQTQFNAAGCGQTNAVVMDTILQATNSTGKSEALSGIFLQTPDGGVVPPVDSYTGAINIIASYQ